MRIGSQIATPFLAVVPLAFLLCACEHVPSHATTDSGTARDAECRVRVVAAMLTDIGTSRRDMDILWPSASDYESREVKHYIETSGLRFRYFSDSIAPDKSEDILLIRHLNVKSQHADVRISFQNKNGFADFLYKLVRNRRAWTVVAREFICAS